MTQNARRGPTCGPVDAFSLGRGGKAGASHAPKKDRTTGTDAAPDGTGRHGIDGPVVPLVVPRLFSRNRHEILRLSPLAWERVAWRRTPLLRVLFGVAPEWVAWRDVLAAPSPVPS